MQALQGIQLLQAAAAVKHRTERWGGGKEAAKVAQELEKEAAEAEAWGAPGAAQDGAQEGAQDGKGAAQKQQAGESLFLYILRMQIFRYAFIETFSMIASFEGNADWLFCGLSQ